MILHIILTGFFFIFNTPFAMAQDGLSQISPAETYQKGLKLYQEKDFPSARDQFRQAYDLEPHNPFILYNWGLSEFQIGNKGMALAAWRKALFLDPDLSSAEEARDFLLATTSLGNISYHKNYWELFRTKVLSRLSINKLFFLTLIFLGFFGWIAVRYFGQRSFAIEEELPLPPLPWVGMVLFLLFAAFQVTAVLKVYDFFIPRATVIAETVIVKSAPTSESSTLFEIYEGSEVLLKRKVTDWSQVKYPGGLTGWVKSQNLFHTSGREL